MNVTNSLLVITVVVFIMQIIMPGITNELIFNGLLVTQEPWRIITSIFLHGGITHIFFNMFALFLFGNVLEREIGSKNLLILYFISGIIGNLAFGYFNPTTYGLGASGAIYGIIGAVALLKPNMTIFLMGIPMPMWVGGIIYALIEIFSMGAGVNSGIAHSAHLFGLVGGLIIAWLVKNNKKSIQYEWEKG